MNTKLLAPSILAGDFSKLGEEIKIVEEAGADIIHLDVMDGRYVPNITIGVPVIKSLRKVTQLPFDAHLMIVEPERYVDDFIQAGVNMLSFHLDATIHAHRLVEHIKSKGVKAGIALNPSNPVNTLEEIIYFIDYVLIMSVNPGFSGQKFIPEVLNKIPKLKKLMEETGRTDVLIEIDGGINQDNIAQISKMGIDIFVAGSSIYRASDKKQAVKTLKEKMNQLLV
ncbi:MAG: ribulose-phosphate 3-epimerase [Aquificae bacterium]|nr:ribulose-phosphate 3-epimerase [Aquificota bacterium]